MIFFARWGGVVVAGLVTTSAFAGLNKCQDGHGNVTYSDKPCDAVVAPPAAPAAGRRNEAALNKAEGGKLTTASVAATLRYALSLGDQLDSRAQCALAAPDLAYKVTDHTPSPSLVMSGGRDGLCQLQHESVRTFQSNGLRPAFSLGKLDITLEPSGTQARARYETLVKVTSYGQPVFSQLCSRDDVLRVHGNEILFAKAVAVCQPAR